MMYWDGPLRLAEPLRRNADDKYAHTHETIALELFLHTIENSSEMVHLFSMEIMFHRPADPAPMSLDNQYILVHYIWLAFSPFDHPPNGIRILDRPT